MEQADGNIVKQYYPSKILGFMKTVNCIEAIIQYSIEEVTWEQLEDDFVVPFICVLRETRRILFRYHLFVILFVSYWIMATSMKIINT